MKKKSWKNNLCLLFSKTKNIKCLVEKLLQKYCITVGIAFNSISIDNKTSVHDAIRKNLKK